MSVQKMQDRPGWAPAATARRRIEPADIAYARARRPHQGWQTIANQLRCNAADLQSVVEGGKDLVFRPAAPQLSAPNLDIKPGSIQARILLAISTGARSIAAAALEAEVQTSSVRNNLPKLLAAKLIGPRGGEGWPLTAAGIQAVRALKQAEARLHG